MTGALESSAADFSFLEEVRAGLEVAGGTVSPAERRVDGTVEVRARLEVAALASSAERLDGTVEAVGVAALVSSAERLDGAVGAVGAAGIAETWEQGCTDPDGDSSGVVIGKATKASDTGGEHGRDGGRLGTQVGDVAVSSGLMVSLRSGMGSPKMV